MSDDLQKQLAAMEQKRELTAKLETFRSDFKKLFERARGIAWVSDRGPAFGKELENLKTRIETEKKVREYMGCVAYAVVFAAYKPTHECTSQDFDGDLSIGSFLKSYIKDDDAVPSFKSVDEYVKYFGHVRNLASKASERRRGSNEDSLREEIGKANGFKQAIEGSGYDLDRYCAFHELLGSGVSDDVKLTMKPDLPEPYSFESMYKRVIDGKPPWPPTETRE